MDLTKYNIQGQLLLQNIETWLLEQLRSNQCPRCPNREITLNNDLILDMRKYINSQYYKLPISRHLTFNWAMQQYSAINHSNIKHL